MKYLLIIFLSLSSANAFDKNNMKDGECHPAWPFHCIVNQKLADHVFGAVCTARPFGNLNEHIIFRSQRNYTFAQPIEGRMGIKYVEEFKENLANGFPADVQVYDSCEYVITKEGK